MYESVEQKSQMFAKINKIDMEAFWHLTNECLQKTCCPLPLPLTLFS